MLSSACRSLARRQRSSLAKSIVLPKRGPQEEEIRRRLNTSTLHSSSFSTSVVTTCFHRLPGEEEDRKNAAQRQRWLLKSLPSSSTLYRPSIFAPTTTLPLTLFQIISGQQQSQQRWHSSTTTPTTESGHNKKKSKGRLGKLSKKARDRAEEMRDSARHRAEEMRDSAREQYREFKEHPKESAVKGAKTAGEMIRLYGPVFVGTYGTIYVSTLGVFFLGVQSGALDPAVLLSWLGENAADAAGAAEESKNTVTLVVDFLNSHAWTRSWAPFVEKNPSVANLAVAWISVKFTEPIRLPLAAAVTPRVARYIGWSVKHDDEDEEEESTDEPVGTNSDGTSSPPVPKS